jgi:hypothetical protein
MNSEENWSDGLLAATGRMDQHEWEPLIRAKLMGFAACVGLFLLLVLRSEPGIHLSARPRELALS